MYSSYICLTYFLHQHRKHIWQSADPLSGFISIQLSSSNMLIEKDKDMNAKTISSATINPLGFLHAFLLMS